MFFNSQDSLFSSNSNSLEKERACGPQAIALLVATSNHTKDETVADDQNPATGENKVIITEVGEFVLESEDVFMHDEASGTISSLHSELADSEDKEIIRDETIHEVAVGKGLSGALKLLKERGTLKQSIEWGGRNVDKKKSKLIEIVDDEGKNKRQNRKQICIERRDEFGRRLTPKESYRAFSHKFHGKGPGKKKLEKGMKQYEKELKIKKMNSSDTPSLSAERMREARAHLRTPYLVLN